MNSPIPLHEVIASSQKHLNRPTLIKGHIVADQSLHKMYLVDWGAKKLSGIPFIRIVSDKLFERITSPEVQSLIKVVPGGSFDLRANCYIQGMLCRSDDGKLKLSDISLATMDIFQFVIGLVGDKEGVIAKRSGED